MDKDLDQAKGRIKQAAGDLTGDERLRREGTRDEAAGKVKEGVERASDRLEDAVDDLTGRDDRR